MIVSPDISTKVRAPDLSGSVWDTRGLTADFRPTFREFLARKLQDIGSRYGCAKIQGPFFAGVLIMRAGFDWGPWFLETPIYRQHERSEFLHRDCCGCGLSPALPS